MFIKSLYLKNFRNYSESTFEFSPLTNLIVGPNAAGKTNILEAIFLLDSTKSFKAETNEQMINWSNSWALIEGKVIDDREETSVLSVSLVKEKESRFVKKITLINQVIKTRKQFSSCFYSVLFRPEDIRLITSSPTRRRNFLDNFLSQVDWSYRHALLTYQRSLRQRNILLDRIREGTAKKEELYFWDRSLVKNGELITASRALAASEFNQFFKNHHHKEIRNFSVNYLSNRVTLDKLSKNLDFDLRMGWTSIGPHKDDFSVDNEIFDTKDKNVAFWGSRAQQRLATLSLKLAELDFVGSKVGQKPALLLDDIFSELDESHQLLLTEIINQHQTIITATQKPENLSWKPENNISLERI